MGSRSGKSDSINTSYVFNSILRTVVEDVLLGRELHKVKCHFSSIASTPEIIITIRIAREKNTY